jgi:hypothetical protein
MKSYEPDIENALYKMDSRRKRIKWKSMNTTKVD